MYSDSFNNAIKVILRHEGGYVNHPTDPGGETNFGISKRAYPKVDIKNLTVETATMIYNRDYWGKILGDSLPAKADLIVFDMAVNMGVSRAIKLLQEACGATVDGLLGVKTLERANSLPNDALCSKLTQIRINYYAGLPTFNTFGKGWVRRSIETLVEAIK